MNSCKDSQELTSGSTGNCRCRQPHCLLMPHFSLDATNVIREYQYKTYIVRMPAFLPVITWASSFRNSWWTPKIQIISKQEYLTALHCHPRSLILAKNWKPILPI